MTTKKARSRRPDQLRREYKLADPKNLVRGKHYPRAVAGSALVKVDADLLQAFPTAKAVNEALRRLVAVASTKVHKDSKRRRPA